MLDSLFQRSANAIEQSRSLREERQMLMEQHEIAVDRLRQTIAECAMTRSEVEADRQDRSSSADACLRARVGSKGYP